MPRRCFLWDIKDGFNVYALDEITKWGEMHPHKHHGNDTRIWTRFLWSLNDRLWLDGCQCTDLRMEQSALKWSQIQWLCGMWSGILSSSVRQNYTVIHNCNYWSLYIPLHGNERKQCKHSKVMIMYIYVSVCALVLPQSVSASRYIYVCIHISVGTY